jgi:hypothetical protein
MRACSRTGHYGHAVADTEFKRKDRVVAAEDLPGVPAGTPGTVLMVTGLSWIRYRVQFDNGFEHSLVDGRYLKPAQTKKKARA